MVKDKKISPIKDRPLHSPGQSLDEEIDRVMNDEIMTYFVMCIFSLGLAGYEWYRSLYLSPPQPWAITSITIIVIGYSIIKINKARPKLKALRLGRDGEKIVGQYLEELRGNGYRVLHDIVGDGFNVDHVIISSHGIFAIETKTLSKPKGKISNVEFDGSTLLVDGHENNQYLTQVKSEATWLHILLKESTGRPYEVRPVIVFPGWFVKSKGKTPHKDIWVLNPKNLSAFIAHQNTVLQPEDVQLATFHLTRYIRSFK